MSFTDYHARDRWASSHGLRPSSMRHWTAILGKRTPPWHIEPWEDHCEVWTQNRKAVCSTSHPYNEPDLPELHNLHVEVYPPESLASWYYPDATWLVILVAKDRWLGPLGSLAPHLDHDDGTGRHPTNPPPITHP